MTDEDLQTISFRYLREASYGTLVLLIFLGIFALPMLLGTIAEGEVFIYVSFGVLGWSLYFGQEYAIQRMKNPEMEFSSEEQSILESLGAVLYFNSILFIGAVLAIVATELWSPFMGLMFALVYPVYDTEMASYKLPLSFGGICAALLWLIERLGSSISEFVSSIEMPDFPYGEYLTEFPLSYFNRHRPRPR